MKSVKPVKRYSPLVRKHNRVKQIRQQQNRPTSLWDLYHRGKDFGRA